MNEEDDVVELVLLSAESGEPIDEDPIAIPGELFNRLTEAAERNKMSFEEYFVKVITLALESGFTEDFKMANFGLRDKS